MSGLRLTQGGVHLGHYLGCLSPLDNIDCNNPIYFVIRDRGTEVNINRSFLLDILIDLSATKYASRIKFVLQSDLQPYFSPIYDYLQDIITLNQLQQTHPHRIIIKKGTSPIYLKDFLFPLESICTYFILNADRVLMNDDNLKVVKFANQVSRKISIRLNSDVFPQPVLVHGKLPRLLGYNYEKACKANNNVIFLSDTKENVEHKLNKLLSFRYLFRTNKDLAFEREKKKEDFVIPNDFLPFQYLYAFSNDFNKDQDLLKFNLYKNFDELSYIFKKEMHILFDEIRENRNEIKQKPEILMDKLHSDTTEAINIAKNMLEHFMSKLEHNEISHIHSAR